MNRFLLVIVLFIGTLGSIAQDFSNKGKDFWVAYGYHQIMLSTASNANDQQMVLYFATDQVTTITISIPGNGYTQTLTSGPLPTVLTSAPIPKTGPQDARLLAESISGENKGIHIVANRPVVAYAHIYNQSVSGASILFPTNTLGKEYYSINFTNNSNTSDANCWFYVVATDTGATTVEITPSANTINHAAGVPFTVNLTQGQVFNVMGILTGGGGGGFPNTGVDLTGSKIKSVSSGNGACKKIAVYSGSGRIAIACDGSVPSSDNYMTQAFPKAAWGKKFLTAHTNTLTNNIYRICVSDPAAVVTVNGAAIAVPLQNNFFYELPATPAHLRIEANLPITVAQYITSQGACNNFSGGTLGDPEVIYLSPVEQNIASVLWNATPNFSITQHYFNVVIPNTGSALSSFTLDGVAIGAAAFTVHPQDPSYSYLIRAVSQGPHRIQSDSGFNAVAYGYGAYESYGYNAGTNIKDLYNFLTPINPLSISPDPVACTGTDFYFSVTFPFQPTSLLWNFHNSPFLFPNSNSVTIPDANTIFDGTYFIGTRQVWRYKLPSLYRYVPANSNPGYPVTITAGTTNTEGCGNSFERDFDLAVYDPPTANYSWTNNGCITDSVRFTDITNYVAGTYSYRWYWDFGDGTFGNIRNPAHLYATPGTYVVRFALTSNVGCLSDTMSKTIVISPLPVASISGATTVCRNGTSPNITFTGTVGTAPFTFTYNINGGPDLTVATATNIATLPVSTSTVGTFVYTLTAVQGQNCLRAQSLTPVTVVVNPLPTATITGSTAVCRNAPSPLITFTGSGATAPYKFTYKINGGANQTIITTTGNSITLPVSTATVGTFTYTLVSIQDASTTTCIQNQTGSVVVTVNPLPTAVISGTTAVCLNAPAPLVTFTGAGGTAPYTFTYSINSGAPLTVTASSSTIATVSVPSTVAGTFVYTLISVQESGATDCQQLQGGSATVTVFPLPVANFSNSTPNCENKQISFSDASTPNAGFLNFWTWDFGDGSPVLSMQNPFHTFSNAGTYNVRLFVRTNNGCQSAVIIKPVIVSETPVAGFVNPEVCLSDTYAEFSDTSHVDGGSIVSWAWNFDDPVSGAANTSTAQNPQHSYSTVGTKNVRLIVVTNSGCRDTIIQSFFVNGDVPVANFAVQNSAALCANDSVRIQNTSTVNVGNVVKVEIHWDNNGAPGTFEIDDFPEPGKIYSHLYPDFQTPPLTNNYQIRFRAYSGATCVDDRIQTIVLNATPNVGFTAIPDTCLNIAPFPILQATETSGIPGTFTFSGPGVSAMGIFNPAAVGPGIYTIRYRFVSNKGCEDSAQRTIRILAPPVANFGFTTPTCVGQSVTFRDSSIVPVGSLAAWTWDFDDGTPLLIRATGADFTHSFPVAGTYNVKLFVTTTGGCISLVKQKQIVIHPIPQVNFRFTDTACLPNARVEFISLATISDNSQSSFLYNWNFGDGGSSNAANPVHLYQSVGPFTASLQVTSGAGCVSQQQLIVNTIHPQPLANFSADKSGVCLGNGVRFSDESDPKDGTAISWFWDFGDNNVSGQEAPVHTYMSAANFSITHFITNSFGCHSDTVQKIFFVYPYPVVNAGNDLTVLEGESVRLNGTATGNDLTYLWTGPGNNSVNIGLNSTTIPAPLSSPPDDIVYTLTVTSRGGCPATDQVKVIVLKAPKIPNTFSPNGDGRNDRWDIRFLKMYPFAKVQVFTRTGQKVFESKGVYEAWDGTRQGQSLPVDTYYYIIEPESGRKPITGYVTIVK